MPGITGIITRDSRCSKAPSLDAMMRCLMHERSYESGTYVNEGLGLSLGWVCHENAFADCMPVWNEKRNVCLIFAGEEFTERAELEVLRAEGHAFDFENASYLVHLYEEMGPRFLERLNGWFSGVLVDLREGKAILFNDRYGLSRVYFHENADGLFFSSEVKALLSVLPGLRQLDPVSAAEFCSCGCALQNRTLFSGVSLLPGASMWTFARGGKARKQVYFRKESWEEQAVLSNEDYYRKLKETFARVLPRYFRGTKPIGISLTGGLDGRMIMAWARRAPQTLPCYTFGGTYRDCTDVRIARRVAQVCQQQHQVIPVDGEFLAGFPAFAEKAVYVSDGAMDVTGSVELYVNRISKGIAPIRLTGNYGSEILRSNVAFKPEPLSDGLFEPGFMELVRRAAETYARESEGRRLSFIAFKQVPWHHYSRLAVEQSQLTMRAPYLDNDLVGLAYQAPEAALGKEPAFRLIAEGNPALAGIPTDRGLLYEPIPGITRARHFYEEFTFRAEYAYDYGMPQWLARMDHLFAPLHLEKLFLGRHKFYHFRVWYRDAFAGYVKAMLLDSRTRGRPYLQGARLEQMVTHHIKGEANYTSEIHRVLSLELLQRQLIEGMKTYPGRAGCSQAGLAKSKESRMAETLNLEP